MFFDIVLLSYFACPAKLEERRGVFIGIYTVYVNNRSQVKKEDVDN